jgi:transcriptional regulator with XRE-family HTH domain
MVVNPMALKLRAKKLGVLLRDARLSEGRSPADCAQVLGISVDTYAEYEFGNQAPSLPDLEILANYLHVPLEHFWSQDLASPSKAALNRQAVDNLMRLRQRIIGVLLRQARQKLGLSVTELAGRSGIASEQLTAYELGERPVPFPELEVLAEALERPLRDFLDSRHPAGPWTALGPTFQGFTELPSELQTFVSKPVNRPYLELAVRLSEMSVEKLRAVGEGILEITL